METCTTCERSMDGIFKVLLSNNIKSRLLKTFEIAHLEPRDILKEHFTDSILKQEYVKTLFYIELKFYNARSCCLQRYKCVRCIEERLQNTKWRRTIYDFTFKLLCIEKRLFSM